MAYISETIISVIPIVNNTEYSIKDYKSLIDPFVDESYQGFADYELDEHGYLRVNGEWEFLYTYKEVFRNTNNHNLILQIMSRENIEAIRVAFCDYTKNENKVRFGEVIYLVNGVIQVKELTEQKVTYTKEIKDAKKEYLESDDENTGIRLEEVMEANFHKNAIEFLNKKQDL